MLLNAYYCVLCTSRVRIRVSVGFRVKFSVWLVRRYAHVFILICIVIVPCPNACSCVYWG